MLKLCKNKPRPGYKGGLGIAVLACSHLRATWWHMGLPKASTERMGRDKGSGGADEILTSSHLERSLQIVLTGPWPLPSLVWVLPEQQEPSYSRGKCGVGWKQSDYIGGVGSFNILSLSYMEEVIEPTTVGLPWGLNKTRQINCTAQWWACHTFSKNIFIKM